MATKVKLIDNTISPTLAGASFTGDVNFEGGQVQYDASSNSLDLQDSIYLQLGTDNDLRIYHDGSHARLRETTGDFRIQTTSSGVNALVAKQNAAVEIYHAGAKKLETSSTGATVTGNLTVTGDLDITGNVNSASVTDLDVEDKTITLGVGQTEAQSGSSGIIIDGSNASLLWDETNNEFVFNKNLKSGSLQLTADTTSYTENANISYYSSSNAVYVNGAGNDGWLRLNASGTANDRTAINLFGVNQGDLITMKTNSTERIRIDSSGNVGIGTSSPNSYSGQTALTINSTGVARLDLDIGNTMQGYLLAESGYTGLYAESGNHLRLGAGGSERIRIDSAGRVGIGTSSPSNYHAKGDNLVIATPGVGDTGISIVSSSSLTGRIFFADGTSGGAESAGQIKYDHSSNFMSFHTSDNQRMRIDANGNVLIGASSTNFGAFSASTSPQLQVAGSMPQVLLHETDTDKDGYIGISNSTMFIQTADAIPMRFGTNDTEVFRLRSDGTGIEFPDNNTFISTAASPGGAAYEWGSIRRPATSDGGQLSIRQYSSGATAAAYPAYAGGTSGWDEDTGMYFPAANKVGLSGGGTVHLETGAQTSSDMAAVKVNNQSNHKAGKLTVYGGSSTGANGGIMHYNGVGREYRNVVSTHTAASSARYWHIKTNFYSTNNIMFIARVHGYSYGNSGHIVDIQRSGYAYSTHGYLTGSQTVNNGSSSDTLEVYFASDNYLCFRHSTPSSGYYSGLSFDIKFQSPTGYNWNFQVLGHTINSTSGNHY